jgi:GNAT superfamily N-acetyltransferase
MAIRTWIREDVPAINGLLASLADTIDYSYHNDTALLYEQYDTISRHPELYTSLVFTGADGVEGFISVVYYPSILHHRGTALINELVVDPRSRGKGIGRKLVERVIDEARGRGYDEVEVGLEKTNERAAEFYRKCGLAKEYLLLGMEF